MDLELNLSHDQYVNNMSYTSDFEFFENIHMYVIKFAYLCEEGVQVVLLQSQA